jgi:undecaprenyl diphosphate synthase
VHLAIIMDGNGRWATKRGLPRTAGHIEGAKAVRTTVAAALHAGVKTLTLYAFSAANWARPSTEVDALMDLFTSYLIAETHRCIEQSIRVNVIGRRDRLGEGLLRAIEQSERLSVAGARMHLRIVVDYSSHDSIVQAAWRADRSAKLTPEDFHRLLHEVDHAALPAGAVDLLIRTGGERRLSNFMLWELAYAELHFTDCLWPDFNEHCFRCALDDYAGRQRRFGTLTTNQR